MSITGYRQLMEVDLASSLPMPTMAGELAYAVDTDRFYRYKDMGWELIPNTADMNTMASAKTAIRYCENGTFKNGAPKTGDVIIFTDTVTTLGGSATFYATSNKLSTGTALCSYISPDSFQPNYRDTSGVYTPGLVTVAGNIKSISQSFGKQTFAGLVVLGLNVLGSASNPAIPDGVTVKATYWGISV